MNDRGSREALEYVGVVRRRKWLILGVAAVVVGTAVTLSLRQTPVYQARARLIIQPDQSIFGSGQAVATPDYVDTQMQVLASQPVQALVKAHLGAVPRVGTSLAGTTSVVEVSAVSPFPARAAEIANAYVDAYVAYRQKLASTALTSATDDLQGKIDGLQKQIDGLASQLSSIPACTNLATAAGACSQRASVQQDRDSLISRQVSLKQRLDQIQLNSLGTTAVQVVTRAVPPATPVSPTPIRNGLLALGLGLVFGVALALLFEYLDDSIKSKDDLEKIDRDMAVLALIPAIPDRKDKSKSFVVSLAEPTSASAEAFRKLRTSIRFLGVDRPLRTIQITSANSNEGKSTTAANLAVVLAQAGERVVVVSCDLRRPRLHEFFGISNDIGFTSVLLGEATLADALRPVKVDGVLSVLAAGPIPPNPSELLQSERASELLSSLGTYGDTIIIDCPPILPVTDAAVLSAKVDGTLLVVSAGTSTHKQVARAVEVLRQVGAPLIGAVLNRTHGETGYAYPYDYSVSERPAPALTAMVSGNGGNGKQAKGNAPDANGKKAAVTKTRYHNAGGGDAGRSAAWSPPGPRREPSKRGRARSPGRPRRSR